MKRRRLKGVPGPQGPWVLAFESGGDHLSVALWRLTEERSAPPERWRLYGEITAHRGHRHADSILSLSAILLDQAGITPQQLQLVASGRGPGGFTGVRVGLATALGLAAGSECAAWPIDSLDVLAANASISVGPLMPLIDARRGEVYGALYVDGTRVVEASVRTPEKQLAIARDWLDGEQPVTFGSGAVVHGVASRVPPSWHIPRAANTGLIAASEWNRAGRPSAGATVDPSYIRPSDAELNQRSS